MSSPTQTTKNDSAVEAAGTATAAEVAMRWDAVTAVIGSELINTAAEPLNLTAAHLTSLDMLLDISTSIFDQRREPGTFDTEGVPALFRIRKTLLAGHLLRADRQAF